MNKGFKYHVPFLVVGLICIAAAVWDFFRPSEIVYAFFALTDRLWAQLALALGLICFAVALLMLGRRSAKNGGKGALPALAAVLMLLGTGGILWKLYRDDIHQYRLHEYVAADRQHSIFGLTVYDAGSRARHYYVQDGEYSYRFITEVPLDTYDPSDSSGYIAVENDGVYVFELQDNTMNKNMVYKWNDQ